MTLILKINDIAQNLSDTACEIQRNHTRTDTLQSATPNWHPSLQNSWTPEKALKYPDTYGKV